MLESCTCSETKGLYRKNAIALRLDFGVFGHGEQMGSSEDIVLSIIQMLKEKYTPEKNVTIQRIFDKYSSRLVKGRQITMYLARLGILAPRHKGESIKEANLWEINMKKVDDFLKNNGAALPVACPLCGGGTISNKYNTYHCKSCFFEGVLTDDILK